MKVHSSTVAEQDNIVFNLHNAMEILRLEMMGKKGVMIKCPVCLDKVGLVIQPKRRTQTVKCRRCKNIIKIAGDSFGQMWKVKSELGIQIMGDY